MYSSIFRMPTFGFSSAFVVILFILFLAVPSLAQKKSFSKPGRQTVPIPGGKDTLIVKSLNPIQGPGNPGIGDPNACVVCPSEGTFAEANWFIHPDNNTAFLCGNTGPLSFGFNAAHGQGLGVNGVEAIPYRYTFNLENRSSNSNVFEGIGILAPMNATASPPGQINCNGLLLSPYWGVSTNNNNPLTLGTNNGSNRTMEIFSNGHVGIGVGGVSPAETFAVNGTTLLNGNTEVAGSLRVNPGTTNVGRLWQVNSQGQTAWVNPTSVFNITGDANKIAKFTGGANGLIESDIFNENGKVRIGGTNSPEFNLEVNSSATDSKILKVGNNSNYMKFSTNVGTTPNINYLDFGGQQQDGSSVTVFRSFYQSQVPKTFLSTDGTGVVRIGHSGSLRVNDNGKVRIGLSSEVGDLYNASLHTMGSIRIGKADASAGDDNRLIFSGGGLDPVTGVVDGENNCGIWFQRKNISNSKSALQLHFGGMESADPAQVSRLEIGYHDGPQTSNTIKRRIALYANGEIQARKVKVTLDDLADYVFKPDYKLRSLKETEAYIKANGHLPEVPSQAEVAKDGMDVGEMNNILLKKIEEMTLHLIRIEKEIEALKNKK